MPQAILVDAKNITGQKTMTIENRLSRIGRGMNNDLVIPNDTVSGFHATIEYREGNFYLEDQRSTNGTRLNGEDLEPGNPQRLKSGDEIMFDIFEFIFVLEDQYPAGETGDRE